MLRIFVKIIFRRTIFLQNTVSLNFLFTVAVFFVLINHYKKFLYLSLCILFLL